MTTSEQTPGKAVHSSVPRWIENGHIFLWLLKDICWVHEWKIAGMIMIVPTLSVALFILWRTMRVRSEVFHNLAICLWICGNSVWMLGEFFHHETRRYTFGLFVAGLVFMLYYYLFVFPKQRGKNELFIAND